MTGIDVPGLRLDDPDVVDEQHPRAACHRIAPVADADEHLLDLGHIHAGKAAQWHLDLDPGRGVHRRGIRHDSNLVRPE